MKYYVLIPEDRKTGKQLSDNQFGAIETAENN